MSIYSSTGKKIGGDIGEHTGEREGEKQYEDKGVISKFFTNKKNFIKKHSKEGKEKGEVIGENIGKVVGISMLDIEEGIETIVDAVDSIKTDN